MKGPDFKIETIVDLLKKKMVSRDDEILKSNLPQSDKIMQIISKISSLVHNNHINLEKQLTKNIEALSYSLNEN